MIETLKQAKYLVFLILMFSAACTPSGVDYDERHAVSDFELYIEYVNKGTKSEGTYGRLFKQDQEVTGQSGDTLVVNNVTFQHFGNRPDSQGPHGWHFQDPALRPYSWQE